MNDNEFWVKFWRTVALAFLGLVVSVSSCVCYTNYQVRALVENAHISPFDAQCAFGPEAGPLCAIRAAK